MKNKEKYAKEILEIACNGDSIAIIRESGRIAPCDGTYCSACLFRDVDCREKVREWEEPEYIEKFDAKKLELTRKELDSVIYHDFMKKGRE